MVKCPYCELPITRSVENIEVDDIDGSIIIINFNEVIYCREHGTFKRRIIGRRIELE